MSDDLSKRGKPDRIRVNPKEPYEVRDWAKHWGVTQQDVVDAEKNVGPMANDVEAELRRRGKIK